jgi:Fur family ferric uptake transcriptional regulator
VVLEELKKLKCHPTAAELYEVARRHMPKISLGTVYRNLELLASNGVIKKLEFGGGEARFDGDTTKHYHARCIHCGRVDDVCGLPSNFATGDFEELNGYEILGVRLEFFGVCAECRGNPAAQSGLGASNKRE